MRRAALIAALAAGIGSPSVAEAATVSQPYSGDSTIVEYGETHVFRVYTLSFHASPGEANDVTFEHVDADPRAVLVKDAGASLEPGENCHAADGGVECAPPAGENFSGPGKIDLGDRDDRLSVPKYALAAT